VYSPWGHLLAATAIGEVGATCFPSGRVCSLTKGGVTGLVPINSIKNSPLGGNDDDDDATLFAIRLI